MGRAKLKSLDTDQVDLTRLPNNKIADKARSILDAIQAGESFQKFHGKRLKFDRTIISVPVNRDYRLIYDQIDDTLTPRKVIGHEDYNATKPCER